MGRAEDEEPRHHLAAGRRRRGGHALRQRPSAGRTANGDRGPAGGAGKNPEWKSSGLQGVLAPRPPSLPFVSY